MQPFVIGIDMGSSGFKITLLDSDGKILSKIQKAIVTNYPNPGWAEQNPQDWEKTLQSMLAEILDHQKIKTANISCIAISAATHTLVCLDKTGKPLRPAILWTDKRTINEVEWLRDNYNELIVEKTLHAPNVNWTLPYLLWIKKYEPQVWSKIDKILMPKDYIRLQLTGIIATDFMDAHGTLLLNVLKRKWSKEICTEFGIPESILPDIFGSEHIVGVTKHSSAKVYGLPSGIPVIIGTTDQACEALGTGTIKTGTALIKLATAGNVVVVTNKPYPDPPAVYAYYNIKKNLWSTMSGTSSCAVSYQWIQNILCSSMPQNILPYSKMDALASNIPCGSEGLVFHPNFQGSLVDPYLKADFVGITPRHTTGHLLRAVLEGVGFSIKECINREEKLGVKADEFKIIGGGSKSKFWSQIICDIIGKKLVVPYEDDSSFGTALLAAVAIGFFNDLDESVKRCVKIKEALQPDSKNHEIYKTAFKFYLKTQEALSKTYRSFHKFSTVE